MHCPSYKNSALQIITVCMESPRRDESLLHSILSKNLCSGSCLSPIRVFLLSLMLKNIEALTSINFILPCQLLISTAWRFHNQGNCASSHEYRCHNRGRNVVCIWDKQHKTLRYFLQGNPGVNYNSIWCQNKIICTTRRQFSRDSKPVFGNSDDLQYNHKTG